MQQHLHLLNFCYKMSYHQNMRNINFSSKKHKTNSSTDLPRALEKFSVIKITWNGCIPFVEFLFEKISVKIHNISRVSLTNYKLLFQGCVHSLSRKKNIKCNSGRTINSLNSHIQIKMVSFWDKKKWIKSWYFRKISSFVFLLY